jgi:hypothetical protein
VLVYVAFDIVTNLSTYLSYKKARHLYFVIMYVSKEVPTGAEDGSSRSYHSVYICGKDSVRKIRILEQITFSCGLLL